MVNFVDTVTVSGTRKRTEDGALVVDARVARTGIQNYLGREVGKPEMAVVRVFRPADEVFSRDTLASFAHRPITNDHPNKPVTADNWKEVAVGHTGDEVTAQDIFVRVPMMVSDGAAVGDVEAGKRELSAGYSCDLDFTPGVTQSGETYDAVQRNIRVNHIAIVTAGRAGKEVRIGDNAPTPWGVSPIIAQDAKQMKTIMIDGLPVEVNDMAEAVINRQIKTIADRDAEVTRLTGELTARDTKIGEMTVQLRTAQTVDIDGLVAARTALIADAHKVVPDLEVKGLSDSDVRKAVVVKVMGEDSVKDQPVAVVDGMFRALVINPTNDTFRQTMMSNDGKTTSLNDNGQSEYEARISGAWKEAK